MHSHSRATHKAIVVTVSLLAIASNARGQAASDTNVVSTDSAIVASPDSAVVAGSTTHGPKRPVWNAKLDADIVWLKPTLTDVVLVATKRGLVALDGPAGTVLWRKDDLDDPNEFALDVLPRPPLGLLRLKKGVRGTTVRIVVDLTNGAELWNSSQIGLVDAWHQVFAPGLDLLVVSGKVASGDPENVVLGLDVETGAKVWTLALNAKDAKNLMGAPVLFDTDSTIVFREEFKYDLRTGQLLWRRDDFGESQQIDCSELGFGAKPEERADPRPLPDYLPGILSADGSRFFVSGTEVQAFDTATGRALWRQPIGLCGRCVTLIELPQGLLLRTMHELDGNDELLLVDAQSGRLIWQLPAAPKKKKFGLLPTGVQIGYFHMSDPILHGDQLFVVLESEKQLARVDLATGARTNVMPMQLSADGEFQRLDVLDDGFLAIGEQDLEWFDRRGKSIRRRHFDGPGDAGWALAMLAGALVANALPEQNVGGARVTFGASYGPAFERFLREYHATSVFDQHVFMLANAVEAGTSGPALLQIDRSTGEIVAKILVDKKPQFRLDALHDRVFVINDQTLTCWTQ